MAQLENFRLKVFRVVAEHLNFHKAAERLFLTQPAVTLQIKALERDLGVRLFDRKGRSVSLTRQGSILLTYANKLAAVVSEAERELGCRDGQVSGELSLGVSTTIAQYVPSLTLDGGLTAMRPSIQKLRPGHATVPLRESSLALSSRRVQQTPRNGQRELLLGSSSRLNATLEPWAVA